MTDMKHHQTSLAVESAIDAVREDKTSTWQATRAANAGMHQVVAGTDVAHPRRT